MTAAYSPDLYRLEPRRFEKREWVALMISAGQPYHAPEFFAPLLELAAQQDSNILIVVYDQVQAHNLIIRGVEQAESNARYLGDKWFRENWESLFGPHGKRIKHYLRFNDFIANPEYCHEYHRYLREFEVVDAQKGPFWSALNTSTENFYDRLMENAAKNSNIHVAVDRETALYHSRRLQIEEIAAESVIADKFSPLIFYPGGDNPVMHLIATGQMPEGPQAIRQRQLVRAKIRTSIGGEDVYKTPEFDMSAFDVGELAVSIGNTNPLPRINPSLIENSTDVPPAPAPELDELLNKIRAPARPYKKEAKIKDFRP